MCFLFFFKSLSDEEVWLKLWVGGEGGGQEGKSVPISPVPVVSNQIGKHFWLKP
jgi:hypothetical protein